MGFNFSIVSIIAEQRYSVDVRNEIDPVIYTF